MEALYIEGTDETPRVVLNKEGGIFEISGRSLPEDSLDFFLPIMGWIDDYRANPNETTEFVFKLDYFNTASSKFFQDILGQLERINGVTVFWYTYEDDEDLEMCGEEFADNVKIPFVFRQYK
jgi:hypothetical protein